jgi:lipoate-protein ligase A
MKIDRRVLPQILRRGAVVFDRLEVVNDADFRSATMNMAIDEALLESARVSLIRFYRWNFPALSFGYFGKFSEVASYATRCDLVSRWNGGGIVFHGQDLTYSIVIPASDPLFNESPMPIYEEIHCALRDALVATGIGAVVAALADRGSAEPIETGVTDPGYKGDTGNEGHCFAKPVHADVLVNGLKVAGAAQRRTRVGLLQQGSIQLATGRVPPIRHRTDSSDRPTALPKAFETRFARELSGNCAEQRIDNGILNRAREIATRKYGTDKWLRQR